MIRAAGCRTAILAVAVALLPACRASSKAEGPTATLGTAPPITTTSSTNPYAMPPAIDAAYVNRVLAGLDAAMGDVVRLVVRTRTIPPEAFDRLKALYGTNESLQLKLDNFQRDMRNGFTSYTSNPGDKVSIVTELITARPTCVFATVRRDYSAVGSNPDPINPQWVALKPLDASRDPHAYNPTSWAYTYDGFPQDRSQPQDPCAS